MIRLKRVYEPVRSTDGTRFLVERLWPRGIKKASLRLDGWLKELGPSHELRRWFSHDPRKWDGFRRRYLSELRQNATAWTPILKAAINGRVTLLFSSHDTEHNNAVALREFLSARMISKRVPQAHIHRTA